jgi:hypothetical protein
MNSNNINTLTFDNHDTYIYNTIELKNNLQIIKLTPTNSEDTDVVNYGSDEGNLFTNGVKSGVIKFNGFTRVNLNTDIIITSTIGTIITDNGILMYNYDTERFLPGHITKTGLSIKTLATYKSGKYANYLNVEIQVDFEDGYRIVTISY